MQETDSFVSVSPPFISANSTILKQLPDIFCASAVFLEQWQRTAVLHFIIRLKTPFLTIRFFQNGPSTTTTFTALWWTGMYFSAASFILIFFFFCNNALGKKPWTDFSAWATKRHSSLWSSELRLGTTHMWKLRARGTAKIKAFVSMLPTHDCSCLTIIFALIWSSPQSTEFKATGLCSSWCSMHHPSQWILISSHPPHKIKQQYARALRTLQNPEDCRAEAAQWDESKGKTKGRKLPSKNRAR